MRGIPEYALERLCEAPAERVWRCWTDPALFSRWYGPNVDTVIHKMDVNPSGEAHIELKWNEQSLYQKFQYTEVIPHSRLSWLFTSTDANWQTIASPVIENWPVCLITTIKLEPKDDKSLLHLSWTPMAASDEEVRCFTQARLDVDASWNTALASFDEVLKGA